MQSFRSTVAEYYRLQNVVVHDSFEGGEADEVASNIKLVLALLRELHPAYYDLENFHLLVESLGQRVRNMRNLKAVLPKGGQVEPNKKTERRNEPCWL